MRFCIHGNPANRTAGNAARILFAFLILCAGAAAQTGEPTNAQQAAKQQAALAGITSEMQAAETERRAAMSPDELKWELVLEANLGNFYLPLYYTDKDAHHETAWDYVRDDPRLPRMLIIGDSISRGYTLPVRHALAGKVNVHRAPANCGPTASGLKNLNTWLGNGKWDVIVWNFGIHDRETDPDVYRTNLEIILSQLQKTGASIVWVRTTPAPPSPNNHEQYTEIQCQRVNQLADDVMKRHGIAEVDLHALVRPRLEELQLPGNVHFSQAGYELMGAEVAKEVLAVLAGPR
jgi:lysophospholipase L1-like esterase